MRYIFECFGLDCEKENLEDPNDIHDVNSQNKIIQAVIFIYSLESFIYKNTNQACRDWDESKIDNLGPFCVCLYEIL